MRSFSPSWRENPDLRPTLHGGNLLGPLHPAEGPLKTTGMTARAAPSGSGVAPTRSGPKSISGTRCWSLAFHLLSPCAIACRDLMSLGPSGPAQAVVGWARQEGRRLAKASPTNLSPKITDRNRRSARTEPPRLSLGTAQDPDLTSEVAWVYCARLGSDYGGTNLS